MAKLCICIDCIEEFQLMPYIKGIKMKRRRCEKHLFLEMKREKGYIDLKEVLRLKQRNELAMDFASLLKLYA